MAKKNGGTPVANKADAVKALKEKHAATVAATKERHEKALAGAKERADKLAAKIGAKVSQAAAFATEVETLVAGNGPMKIDAKLAGQVTKLLGKIKALAK